MSPVHVNVLRFAGIVCIWIMVLTVVWRIVTDNGKSYYYAPSQERLMSERAAARNAAERLDVDTSLREPNELEYLDKPQQELPNVPFDYWRRFYEHPIKQSDNCSEYPYLLDLNYHNTYWQTFQSGNATVQLYGAYYDKRESLPKGPAVRLLAMISQKNALDIPKSFCQFWFENSTESVIRPVSEYQSIYPKYWGLLPSSFYPYLITCEPLEPENGVPRTVSLIEQRCKKIRNNLRIHFETPKEIEATKPKFAVCVKGLNYPYSDKSALLVEWLELLQVLGVSKVLVYNLAVHANMSKVLAYYQESGFVDVTPLTLASGVPNLPHLQYAVLKSDQMQRRLNEFIPYNDCFYRHMYKFDYIALLDIDEVIMPKRSLRSWADILQSVKEKPQREEGQSEDCSGGYAGICFSNAYFSEVVNSIGDDIASYMHMLRHNFRLAQHSDVNAATKCFHNTATVRTLHNHFPLTWLKGCGPTVFDEELGQLQHYRRPENDFRTDSEGMEANLVDDNSMYRFKNELISRTQRILVRLGFLRV